MARFRTDSLVRGLILFLNIQLKNAEAKADTMSVVINSADHVQIQGVPDIIDNSQTLILKYMCAKERILGVEIVTNIEKREKIRVFSKAWRCEKGSDIRFRDVKIRMPDWVAYRPDLLNEKAVVVEKTKLKAWIVDSEWWEITRKSKDSYARALAKVSYDVSIEPPYSRPPKAVKGCKQWFLDYIVSSSIRGIPKCPHENEVVHLLRWPVAINGLRYGIYRKLQPFADAALEHKRLVSINRPRFTLSIWVYVLQYCETASLCSIVFVSAVNDTLLTPVLFLTPTGQIHVQCLLKNYETAAHLTDFALPKHQWIRLVFSVDARTWTLAVSYGKKFNTTLETSAWYADDVYMDDTAGHMILGGTERQIAFKGYIGEVIYYRLNILSHKNILFPSLYHPMFELGVMHREQKCKTYISRLDYLVFIMRKKKDKGVFKGRCTTYMYDIINNKTSEQRSDWCPISDFLKRKEYSEVRKLLRKHWISGRDSFDRIKWAEIAKSLYERATDLIEENLKNIRKSVMLLKQSACHGNNDAMYMLSVILNNGLMVRADEIQAQAYLMMASLDQHRLSSLSLGSKHFFGIDGVPCDKAQAYVYFKFVADKTNEDRDKHQGTDVMTESVRLTDEVQLSQQTDEEGDLFHWFKHQAKQGVTTAQQHVARSLFWGSQGLKRNMEEAVNFFKMGAESKEPEAVYDYGILVFRGQGTEKNETEGLKHIQEAADSKHPPAISALGWYALNYDRNYVKAAEYFEKAYSLGSVDGGFHLGYMHYYGLYPNQSKDVDKAWNYFNWAAARHHVFSGILVAQLYMRGTEKTPPDQNLGVEWAQYIAEMNPALGAVLRKGLHAYRHADIPVAFFYYMMAAEAGIEVGSFNYAWLCEEDKDGFTNYIEKECQWKHFNLSVQRNIESVDSYSLLKMGDYYWYGCERTRNVKKAAYFYSKAAEKQDPQAIFNLAFMIEEGATLPESLLSSLKIERSVGQDKQLLLAELYSRCRESGKSEAYMPCTLSLWRLQITEYWQKYNLWLILSSVIGAVMALIFAVYMYKERHRNNPVDTYVF